MMRRFGRTSILRDIYLLMYYLCTYCICTESCNFQSTSVKKPILHPQHTLGGKTLSREDKEKSPGFSINMHLISWKAFLIYFLLSAPPPPPPSRKTLSGQREFPSPSFMVTPKLPRNHPFSARGGDSVFDQKASSPA